MSKKISMREKNKWLDMFEEGMTETQIAKKTTHDPRTIVKGLEEATKERRLASAEYEMLRDALAKHQNQLTGILDNIIEMLVLPPHDLKLREESEGILAPIPLSCSLVKQISKDQMILEIYDEEKLEWELLKEHLNQDKLWGYINQWREAILDYMWAIWQFKLAIKAKVENGAYLKSSNEAKEKRYNTLRIEITNLFYEVAASLLLGIRNVTDIKESIDSKLSGIDIEESFSQKLKVIFDSLSTTKEASKIKSTYATLADITKIAKRQAQETKLLNIITGKCRVCRRLGL